MKLATIDNLITAIPLGTSSKPLDILANLCRKMAGEAEEVPIITIPFFHSLMNRALAQELIIPCNGSRYAPSDLEMTYRLTDKGVLYKTKAVFESLVDS